ncbi:MAG: hypothetical protein L6Q77_13265 [Bacteroidetes bacterium]|nr:hypothetical protein [Bacteroidota bacterium]
MHYYKNENFFGFYIKEVDSVDTDHFFGGNEIINGAFCPNCERLLTPLFTIKVTDEIRGIMKFIPESLEIIPLFYCWTCDLFEENEIVFYYSVGPNCVKYLKVPKGKKVDGWPYKNYPPFFERIGVELIKYSRKEYQVYIDVCTGKFNWLDVINENMIIFSDNTILNNPCFIDNKGHLKTIKCPICCKPMKYLGKFGDSLKMQNKFIGNSSPVMVFHFCEVCCTVGTYHYID